MVNFLRNLSSCVVFNVDCYSSASFWTTNFCYNISRWHREVCRYNISRHFLQIAMAISMWYNVRAIHCLLLSLLKLFYKVWKHMYMCLPPWYLLTGLEPTVRPVRFWPDRFLLGVYPVLINDWDDICNEVHQS